MNVAHLCTVTRVTVALTLAVMLATSCTPADTVTTPAAPPDTDSTATDTPTWEPSLLDVNEPFDAHEHATRQRFATRISAATARPTWLGVTPLADRAAHTNGQYDTPIELADRRLLTPAGLTPPHNDTFHATVTPATDEILARSTFNAQCPVSAEELAYVTVSFYGFDQVPHTGELLVHRDVADDLITVFATLFDARFPLEEMRIITADELAADPTGDGNVTTGFVCRSVVSGTSWSQHAYGRAIDINPFHNPYLRGETVIPELATTYLDRNNIRPGMIVDGDEVVTAFASIGWAWGGNWSSAKDWMHFSLTGR